MNTNDATSGRDDIDAEQNDSATGAGSESPEEGEAAMDTAEDAVVDDSDS